MSYEDIKNIDIGIIFTTVSILSGIVFSSGIIQYIQQNRVGIIGLELSMSMLFSSIAYYMASMKFNQNRDDYRNISMMHSLISLGILISIIVV